MDRPSTAREFASATHKQRRDLSIPTTRSLDSTELPDNFYDRLAKLVERGENIGEIMSTVERSPSEALQQLQLSSRLDGMASKLTSISCQRNITRAQK